MKLFHPLTALCLLALFLYGNTLYARTTVQDQVTANFACIYWSGASSEVLDPATLPKWYVHQPDGYEQLSPYLNQMGPYTQYRGSRQMPIYRRSVDEKGQWQYEAIAEVTLPDTSAFILFISRHASDSSYAFAVIDASKKAIPPGSIAFLNLTRKQVAADIRGDRKLIPPMQPALFTPQRSETADLPLQIAVHDEQWRRAYATVIRTLSSSSYLMVFYPVGDHEESFNLRTFRNLKQLREASNSATLTAQP